MFKKILLILLIIFRVCYLFSESSYSEILNSKISETKKSYLLNKIEVTKDSVLSEENLELVLSNLDVKSNSELYDQIIEVFLFRNPNIFDGINITDYIDLLNSIIDIWPYDSNKLIIFIDQKFNKRFIESILPHKDVIPKAITFLNSKGVDYNYLEKLLFTSNMKTLNQIEEIYNTLEQRGFSGIEEIIFNVGVNSFEANTLSDLIIQMFEKDYSNSEIVELLDFYKNSSINNRRDIDHQLKTIITLLKSKYFTQLKIRSVKDLYLISAYLKDKQELNSSMELFLEYNKVLGEFYGAQTLYDTIDNSLMYSSSSLGESWVEDLPKEATKLLEIDGIEVTELALILPTAYYFRIYKRDFIELYKTYISKIVDKLGAKRTITFINKTRTLWNNNSKLSMETVLNSLDTLKSLNLEIEDFVNKQENKFKKVREISVLTLINYATKHYPELLETYSIDFLMENLHTNTLKVEILKQLVKPRNIPMKYLELAREAIAKNNKLNRYYGNDYRDIIYGIINMDYLQKKEKETLLVEYLSTFNEHSLEDLYHINGIMSLGDYNFGEFFDIYMSGDDQIIDNNRYQRSSFLRSQWSSIYLLGENIEQLGLYNKKELRSYLEVLLKNVSYRRDFQISIMNYLKDLEEDPRDVQLDKMNLLYVGLNRDPVSKYLDLLIKNLTKFQDNLIKQGYQWETTYSICLDLVGNTKHKSLEQIYKDSYILTKRGYSDEDLISIFKVLYGSKSVIGNFNYNSYKKKTDILTLEESFELSFKTAVPLPDNRVGYTLITPDFYKNFQDYVVSPPNAVEDEIITWSKSVIDHSNNYTSSALNLLVKVDFFNKFNIDTIDQKLEILRVLETSIKSRRKFYFLYEGRPPFNQFIEYISQSPFPISELLIFFEYGIESIDQLEFFIERSGNSTRLKELIQLCDSSKNFSLEKFLTFIEIYNQIKDRDILSDTEIVKLYRMDLENVYNSYPYIKEISQRKDVSTADSITHIDKYWRRNSYNNTTYNIYHTKFWNVLNEEIEVTSEVK